MTIQERLAAIQKMTFAELKAEWRALFGEEPRSGNTPWLRKRLAWGLQAREFGGLSEAAQRRIAELLPQALASMPWGFRSFPAVDDAVSHTKRSRSTPKPGSIITRSYRGRTLQLLVRDDGRFELDGTIYATLTAAAQGATGSHWNGTLFWFGRKGKTA